MSTTRRFRGNSKNAPCALAVMLAGLCALLAWTASRSLASKRSSYAAAVRRVEQMSADVARIETLRSIPRRAVERQAPNDELLGQIRLAADAASIPGKRWIGNDPSAPVRVPDSPYKRLGLRLRFEEVLLQQLVTFAHHLILTEPALSIPYLRLTAPRNADPAAWNADMQLAYLIYSPRKEP